MKTDVYECIIIGGGAAGLYCAAKLARSYYSGKKILIIEGGSRVGAKLALTGCERQQYDGRQEKNLIFTHNKFNGI